MYMTEAPRPLPRDALEGEKAFFQMVSERVSREPKGDIDVASVVLGIAKAVHERMTPGDQRYIEESSGIRFEEIED